MTNVYVGIMSLAQRKLNFATTKKHTQKSLKKSWLPNIEILKMGNVFLFQIFKQHQKKRNYMGLVLMPLIKEIKNA